jgi:hypothetical protein
MDMMYPKAMFAICRTSTRAKNFNRRAAMVSVGVESRRELR